MELIEGDRIIYEGSQYFITYIIKNSGSTIYSQIIGNGNSKCRDRRKIWDNNTRNA